MSLSKSEDEGSKPSTGANYFLGGKQRTEYPIKQRKKRKPQIPYDLLSDEEKQRRDEIKAKRMKNIESHQFKPGQSGNPKGRPKTPEATKQLLKDSSYEAAYNLIRISKNPKHPKQLQACQDILDRTFGKATQPLDFGEENAIKVILEGDIKELAK